MSEPTPAALIGEAILGEEHVGDALRAYVESWGGKYTLADCAAHLVKLALVNEGWLVSRQVTEYDASPRLEAHLAARSQAPVASKKRRPSALRLVAEGTPTV